MKSIIESNVKVNPDTGCWEFQFPRGDVGYYGTLVINGVRCNAHRVAYEAWVGEIPEGMFVCHRCDNKTCCNPEHLFLGTPQDNIQDMMKKGRFRRALSSKVIEQIDYLHNLGLPNWYIADRVGVCLTTVSKYVNNQSPDIRSYNIPPEE